MERVQAHVSGGFPYFFVGTFIEGVRNAAASPLVMRFPYFFVGTFIEGSLDLGSSETLYKISLLFRRDFH